MSNDSVIIEGAEESEPLIEKATTPLPLGTLIPLCCIVFAEPMIFSIIFPFIFFMVKSFGVAEVDVGNYAGWIAGSFSIAQAVTSYPIGWVSDRIGRRPILLAGLVGNIVTVIGFGFSKSLVWAMVTRSICGFLNGNVGIAKCVIAEITDSSNRGTAFSMIGFMWSLGGMIGPALGGLLADPVGQYPGTWISRIELFQEYPYLLPCLASSVFSLFGLVMAIMYMPETSRPEPVVITTDLEESSDAANIESDINAVLGDESKMKQQLRSCYHAIVSYALLALCGTLFVELYPLWTATEPGLGGLGFSTRDIGVSITVTGAVSLVFQILAYPRLEARFSAKQLFRLGLAVFILVHPTFPLLSKWILDQSPGSVLWTLLLVLLGVRTIASVLCFTSIMILINASAPEGMLGSMNGIAQMGASAVRSVAPPICGMLYAWSLGQGHVYPFDYNLVFCITSITSLLALLWSTVY